jgi:hypothetical protein
MNGLVVLTRLGLIWLQDETEWVGREAPAVSTGFPQKEPLSSVNCWQTSVSGRARIERTRAHTWGFDGNCMWTWRLIRTSYSLLSNMRGFSHTFHTSTWESVFSAIYFLFDGRKIHLSLKSRWVDCFHFTPATLLYSCLYLSFSPVNITPAEMFVMTC